VFDLEKGTLTQYQKECPIVEWQVWYVIPKGVTDSIQEAIRICQENDWGPNAVIQPVPVAIDEDGRYEIIVRR
jgi:hypothetical protein